MIDWLLDQVLSLWRRIGSLASQALTWARSEGAKALASAKAFVTEVARQLEVRVTTARLQLKFEILRLIYAAAALARSLVEQLRARFELARLQLRSEILRLLSAAVALARTLADQLSARLQLALLQLKFEILRLVYRAVAFVTDNLPGLRALVEWYRTSWKAGWDFLLTLIPVFTPAFLSMLLTIVQGFGAWLLAFLQDPTGILVAYLERILVTLWSELVAYGLGTVKYDLPPRTVFGANAAVLPVLGGTGPPPGASGLAKPLGSLRISGYRFGPGHQGVDFGLSRGQAVFACHDGVVQTVRRDVTGYGWRVDLAGEHWWSRYAHLGGIGVEAGQSVAQRQAIAAGDSTGNSSGDHLHLELKYDGKYVDPAVVFGVG